MNIFWENKINDKYYNLIFVYKILIKLFKILIKNKEYKKKWIKWIILKLKRIIVQVKI